MSDGAASHNGLLAMRRRWSGSFAEVAVGGVDNAAGYDVVAVADSLPNWRYRRRKRLVHANPN